MRALPLLALLAPALPSQDVIGVTWSQGVFAIDSHAGTATPLGPGLTGQNDVAIANGALFATHRTNSSPYVYHLTTVDPVSGNATILHSGIPDVRAMASDPSRTGVIWCVLDSPDRLVLLDPLTGSFPVTIGNLGFSGVQALVWHRGTLYAADVVHGLLVVDPLTGAATDVDPAVGVPVGSPTSPTARMSFQFLFSRSDGKLLGGNNDLFEIDPATGTWIHLAALGSLDLRGAVEWFGSAHTIGAGCNATFGPSVLAIGGTLVAGGTLTTSSNQHAATAPGALFIGLGELPVPIDLGALFGANGCFLHVLPELVVPGITGFGAPASFGFTLPLGRDNGGLVLRLQHLVLEPVPGGLSASSASRVHVGY